MCVVGGVEVWGGSWLFYYVGRHILIVAGLLLREDPELCRGVARQQQACIALFFLRLNAGSKQKKLFLSTTISFSETKFKVPGPRGAGDFPIEEQLVI